MPKFRAEATARLRLCRHADGGSCRSDYRSAGLCRYILRYALCTLRQRSTHGHCVNGAVRRGRKRADFGQTGVIQYEGFVLAGNAVENAVRLRPGEYLPVPVDCQPRHMRLPG